MYLIFLKDASVEVHPGTTLQFAKGDLADLFPAVADREIKAGNVARATVEDLTAHGVPSERIPHDTPSATPVAVTGAPVAAKESEAVGLLHRVEKMLGG